MIELTFPVATPSVNKLHGRHWSAKAKWKKQWAWMVRAERVNGRMVLPFADGIRRMSIDRYGPRLLDHDNFVAGTKQLTDALVAEGFLVDDSPEHLVATYCQHVGKPYQTVVRIFHDSEEAEAWVKQVRLQAWP